MFKKLKQRWKVNELHLVLIILTFALGGSLCGYAGRKILLILNMEKGVTWVLLYALLIILLWPLSVIIISIPLGQFRFFKNYIIRVWNKLTGKPTISIAIFASGAGTNAQEIINHFSSSSAIKINLIVCNKPGAGVLSIAEKENIPFLLIEKDRFFNGNAYLTELQKSKISFIVMAGFLWKIPEQLIKAYPKKIINLHPGLLPKYGGNGMYGHFVHDAVIGNKEKESGITIHYIDELYDHGEIIFQAKCTVDENDNTESLSKKIHTLEHTHYAAVIEDIIMNG